MSDGTEYKGQHRRFFTKNDPLTLHQPANVGIPDRTCDIPLRRAHGKNKLLVPLTFIPPDVSVPVNVRCLIPELKENQLPSNSHVCAVFPVAG